MLSKNVLSKILNAATAVVASGVLLGSALTSSSWAMEKEEGQEKVALAIAKGRAKELKSKILNNLLLVTERK